VNGEPVATSSSRVRLEAGVVLGFGSVIAVLEVVMGRWLRWVSNREMCVGKMRSFLLVEEMEEGKEEEGRSSGELRT